MRPRHVAIALSLLLTTVATGEARPQDLPTGWKKPPDPKRFEKAIQAFETLDRRQQPPKHAVVCTGSSSMRMWHKTIHKDLAPLTVVPRGFGGSTMSDLLYFADRVILKYEPKAVVIYEGDNDVDWGMPPEQILATFGKLKKKLHAASPQLRIYVLAVKPSPRRWHEWPTARKTNDLLNRACQADQRLRFIDIATPMLDKSGTVRGDLFLDDRLHMNAQGYALWKKVVRPVLVDRESNRDRR